MNKNTQQQSPLVHEKCKTYLYLFDISKNLLIKIPITEKKNFIKLNKAIKYSHIRLKQSILTHTHTHIIPLSIRWGGGAAMRQDSETMLGVAMRKEGRVENMNGVGQKRGRQRPVGCGQCKKG